MEEEEDPQLHMDTQISSAVEILAVAAAIAAIGAGIWCNQFELNLTKTLGEHFGECWGQGSN